MKVIIAPDKFKGSLTSFAVCDAIRAGILSAHPDAEVLSFPMADGGDGFADVLKFYTGTSTVISPTVDPLGRPIQASWQWNAATKTAIIEVAAASGVVLLKPEEKNPEKASTVGTGLQIKEAIAKGATRILLGLGGSATNDAGTGILEALGFTFLSADGNLLGANGANLSKISSIIPPPALPPVSFHIASDVTNPLFGENGAAFIYAPQKGADKPMVLSLDTGLRRFASLVSRQTGKDLSSTPSMGAAGGIAFGLKSFFDATISSGIELVVGYSNIESSMGGATAIITGEGKMDSQSAQGKVINVMASLAKKHNLPCVAICGVVEMPSDEWKRMGITTAVSIKENGMTGDYAMAHAYELVSAKAQETIGTLIKQ